MYGLDDRWFVRLLNISLALLLVAVLASLLDLVVG